jgi:ribosomal protein S18 acetylase RimI-like enzyme
MTEIRIRPAEEQDLPRILEIQRNAFMKEARILNDYDIAPLHQTVEEARKELSEASIIVAEDNGGRILGSVRWKKDAEGVLIFKLSVDPEFQGQGIAKTLIREIESTVPSKRYYLFTRSDNPETVGLYEKLGYSKYKEEEESPKLTFAYLEKLKADEGAGG